MTKNGLRTSNFSVFGDRRNRLPLFIRRSRGRFRLHRGDDLVRTVDPTIRPTALVLNILVALIGSFQFWRAGHFSWRLFWPFALLSVPAAYFGGYIRLPARVLKIIIGLVPLFPAARLFFRRGDPPAVAPPPLPAALAVGSGIGFLSV